MKKSIIISIAILGFQLVLGCKPKESDDVITSTIPTNGLIAYYPFNGNANDESGFKNHGVTNAGVTLTTDRKSNKDQAYSFGGIDKPGYIKITNSESLNLSKTLSISIWYKLNSYYGMDSYANANQNGHHVLLGKEGDRDGIYMIVDNNQSINKQNVAFYNKIAFTTNFSVWGNPIGTNAENVDKWHHVVTTVDGTSAKCYLDGTLVQTTAISPDFSSANTKDLYIGIMRALSTTWYPFNGTIDDIRIYNRSLSDVEVLALFKE